MPLSSSILCRKNFFLRCHRVDSHCHRFARYAHESPYIVTYDHYLEEPSSLEVEYFPTFGTQRAGNDFLAYWPEFEYGATAWWTTEVYLDGQTTFNDSALFTGFRWENRFRLLQREHFINPCSTSNMSTSAARTRS
jgi:hypothetical protein